MTEPAGIWSDLRPKVENAISSRNKPRKFSGVNYYLAEFYLGESRAEIVAEMIRYHGYLVRVYYKKENGVWYIYVRRK